VQEAMASGVPAVVVDRGGPPGVISPGHSGLVARAHDAQDMADCVQRLVEDAALRRAMGRSARRRALARSWSVVTARLLSEYHRIGRVSHERLRRLA
jgi:phosphatidylinositol alpha 1,6-mannosyltransferase